jgi:hypothetical protein
MASTESEKTHETVRGRVATTRPDSRRGMSKGAIRAERRARSESRKRRKRMFWYAGAIMLAAAFIASLLVPGGLTTNLGDVGPTINTGGPVAILPDEGRGHLEPGVRYGADYRTKPGTSGPHWQTLPSAGVPTGAPARWGIYDRPIPDEVLIHNLEHGGIGLHYNCPEGCPELVEQLRGIIGRNPSQFILAPYPDMDRKIAVTAWRHLLYLDEFDEAKIREFVDAYQDRAPESVPQNPF